ncbi:MAG: hypothetical protein IPH45_20890 [Bacteroidales bacterium]|nr:hypothetical protein [Bacteroidales bacterium]
MKLLVKGTLKQLWLLSLRFNGLKENGPLNGKASPIQLLPFEEKEKNLTRQSFGIIPGVARNS